jgi:hypothetical protein
VQEPEAGYRPDGGDRTPPAHRVFDAQA